VSGHGDVRLAPSILAADFARLGQQVADAEQAGADRIHVDVMDGHFVPNLSMGPAIVQSLRRVTRLPLEIHLMISNPDFFLDEFTEAGSDSFLVHWEGNNNLHRTVHRIRALGKRAAVAINPATPSSVLEEIVPDLDQVLVMTVNPGFGHQHLSGRPCRRSRRCASWSSGALVPATWKWTAESTSRRRPWSCGPAPPCWWRARPSSASGTAWPPR